MTEGAVPSAADGEVYRPRGREWLARLALISLSIAAGALAGEIALRVMRYRPDRLPAMARVHDAEWTTLLDGYPSNPRGYFSIDLRTPEAHARFQWLAPRRFDAIARRAPFAVEFRYNGLRFRERPPDSKASGRRRVAVVGDSFTEGQGVNEPDTYVRRLESRLNAAEPGLWDVRNCARRATDFPALDEVFTAAWQYEPDVVVYGMVLNDAARAPEFEARQGYVNDWILDHTRMQDGPPLDPGLLDSRLWAFVSDRWEARRIGRESTRWYRDMYGPPNAGGWTRTQQSIREMDRRTRARGARFAVALWPLLVDLGPRYPFAEAHETIRRFCATAGIPFVDLRGALAGHDVEALWVHPLDHHPNEIAHQLAAEALLPLVQDER
jgi:hypothetical protein